MCRIITLLFLLTSLSVFSQPLSFQNLLDSGKAEYNRQIQSHEADFRRANALFEQAVKLQPQNTTARYFYGYSLDKLNSPSGEEMHAIQLPNTIRASEQFEAINKMEPAYKGELLVLDPYAKLSAIWGSQALAYLNRGEKDSARWALLEGNRRGGFLEPILDFNRKLLSSCQSGSLLVTSGDNITLSILYLQLVEKYRQDVISIDVNLLHSRWYPQYLKREKIIPITYSTQELDTITYSQWTPTAITLPANQAHLQPFHWTVRPSYGEDYLLRGDKILLDIFKQSLFKKPIYFSEPKPDSTINISLGDHLQAVGILSALVVDPKGFDPHAIRRENLKRYTLSPAYASIIKNSSSTVDVLNSYRSAYFIAIDALLDTNREEAARLFTEMKTKFPESLLPYDPHMAAYQEYLLTVLQEKD